MDELCNRDRHWSQVSIVPSSKGKEIVHVSLQLQKSDQVSAFKKSAATEFI